MGIRKLCTSGRWAVNDEPIYVPDPDVEYSIEPIYSSDSGRLEDGGMWKRRITDKRTVKLKYKYITGYEKDQLVRAMLPADFSLTYYDNGIKTIGSAYLGPVSYKGYNGNICPDEGGVYEEFTLDIVEN